MNIYAPNIISNINIYVNTRINLNRIIYTASLRPTHDIIIATWLWRCGASIMPLSILVYGFPFVSLLPQTLDEAPRRWGVDRFPESCSALHKGSIYEYIYKQPEYIIKWRAFVYTRIYIYTKWRVELHCTELNSIQATIWGSPSVPVSEAEVYIFTTQLKPIILCIQYIPQTRHK